MRKSLAFLALIISLLAASGCESLFFYPDKALRYHPALCEAAPKNVLFPSYDGTQLHGWLFTPQNKKIEGVIFYLHGNGQNISFHIHSLLWLLDAGYAIFAFDYRGYGISQGDPDIKSVLDDSLAALDFMLEAPLPSNKLVMLGQSMGGALAIETAATTKHQDKIKGVAADSAFSSWRRIYREKAGGFFLTWPFQYPISWFISDAYAPEDYITRIPERIKILLIHNEDDEVVPFGHSQRLLKAAGARAEFWPEQYAGHTTALQQKEVQKRFLSWLDAL